jgi:hypothetical protein
MSEKACLLLLASLQPVMSNRNVSGLLFLTPPFSTATTDCFVAKGCEKMADGSNVQGIIQGG